MCCRRGWGASPTASTASRPGWNWRTRPDVTLLLTVGALTAFLIEMLLGSEGIRYKAAGASEHGKAPAPERANDGDGMTAPADGGS